MMVLENERYALGIKGKTVVEPYANVMLDETEVTELKNVSDASVFYSEIVRSWSARTHPDRQLESTPRPKPLLLSHVSLDKGQEP